MKWFWVILIALAVLPGDVWAAPSRSLDLAQAQRLAIERNLDLKAQQLQHRASRALELKGFGLYDPRAELSYTEGQGQEPLNLFYTPSFRGAESRYRQLSFSLLQKLPTGADVGLIYTSRRQDDEPAGAINPAFTGEAALTLRQPLLKNFGLLPTEQAIILAARERETSLTDLLLKASHLVAQVRDTYFQALGVRETLHTREASVALARRILAENKARVEAEVLPQHEILEAEVGLNVRERELLEAQQAYRDALDELAVLVAADASPELAETPLSVPALAVDEEEGYRQALRRRPEIQRHLRQLEKLELEHTLAKNQQLPAVDLVASYGYKSLGDSFADSHDEMASGDFENWEVGLTLSYPLGNRAARYEAHRSALLRKSQAALLAQKKQEVRREIRQAARTLEVSRKKIEVTELGKALAEEKLSILLKRQEVGLATTRDVLEGEEDLSLAHTEHTLALVDYNQSVTEYLRVTGMLLESQGIYVSAVEDPLAPAPVLRMQP
ncbi:MAG: TolC family protein [Desulfuromonadales bacterium]